MKIVARSVVVLLLLLPCVLECSRRAARGTVGANRPMAIPTTVCAIAANPEAFYEKRVTVSGCVRTDGIEHSLLTDPACPYVGIGPGESVKWRFDRRFFPRADRKVCGTFTGVFEKTRSIDSIVVSTNVLGIEEAAHLTVVPSR